MKGLLLLGGHGTRLHPVTKFVNKHFLPIYNKPMFYYSLSVLLNFHIKDIIISAHKDTLHLVQNILQDGSQLGLHISYITQDEPNGIAEPLLLAEDLIDNDNVCMVLGDNVFYGPNFQIEHYPFHEDKATIFAYHIPNPEAFGVLVVDKNKHPINIIEKPTQFVSSWVVPGLYYYPSNVVSLVKQLTPSHRHELEISHLNALYLKQQKLHVHYLPRSFIWYDMGTFESLEQASNNIRSTEKRQGQMIGCIEEIALNRGLINKSQFLQLIETYKNSPYKAYLIHVAETF